jgi:RNA polymerase sigma-70 factor (sigma-E family)
VRFEDYASEQSDALLRLAYVLTRDVHQAEDLAQITLISAYRHWSKVRTARSPDAYLRRMLVHAHLDFHRRHSSTERPADLTSWEPATNEPDLADALVTRDQIRAALDGLPPRARTALVLRYYADLDDAGVAEAMGIGVGSARATISRALAMLRASHALNASEESP